jgi:putative ribosome biogenesis GTPase RsgA
MELREPEKIVQTFVCLLIGDSGAGKSSFVNCLA